MNRTFVLVDVLTSDVVLPINKNNQFQEDY